MSEILKNGAVLSRRTAGTTVTRSSGGTASRQDALVANVPLEIGVVELP